MAQSIQSTTDIAIAAKHRLVASKRYPDSVEDRTLRIESHQAAVVLASGHARARTRAAPHFLQYGFRIANVFEHISSVNEVKTGIREVQPVGITLDKLNPWRLCGSIDLSRRLFPPDYLYIRRRRRNGCSEQAKPAPYVQNTHAGLDVEKFDER